MNSDFPFAGKVPEQTQRRVGNEGYNKMVTAKFNFLVLVALTVYTTLVKKSSIRNSSVKHTYFLANSTKKNALLWRGIV